MAEHGTEGLLQEFNQFGHAGNHQVRSDGMIALRNCFDCNGEFSFPNDLSFRN